LILYVDTSALVPLLIVEPTSDVCGALWDAADDVTATRLVYVETMAALGQALRMGRLSPRQLPAARGVLDELWSVVEVIEVTETLMKNAADLALSHGLRGYDAVHCAAAIAVNDAELVATSGDVRLMAAWSSEGVTVRSTHF
jgi:predicted nucleic acid-binding protein